MANLGARVWGGSDSAIHSFACVRNPILGPGVCKRDRCSAPAQILVEVRNDLRIPLAVRSLPTRDAAVRKKIHRGSVRTLKSYCAKAHPGACHPPGAWFLPSPLRE